jgi:hypothetical protein
MKSRIIDGITYTHRTRDGKPARIVCVDRIIEGFDAVIALVLVKHNCEATIYLKKNLRCNADDEDHDNDLFEGVEPEIDWSKVPIDTPIWCGDDGSVLRERHFAGLNAKGLPTAWLDGLTSHSTCGDKCRTTEWSQMYLENPNRFQEVKSRVSKELR